MTMFNTLQHRFGRSSWSGMLRLGAVALLVASVWLTPPAGAQDSAASAVSVQVPVAPTASAGVEPQVVDNPYGLGALWAQGDFVAKGTLVILVLLLRPQA